MTSYTKSDRLSIRMRSSSVLPRLTRREMLSRLQLLPTVEPMVDKAFVRSLRREWADQTNDSPHGHPWHVSFHASQFPGDDPLACPRQSLYRMMDLPGHEPPTRWLMMTAAIGTAFEKEMVKALHNVGKLLSAAPEEEVQTGFEIPEHWLTGSVDCVVEMRRRPTPIEIKTKHESVIAKMRLGAQGPDAGHVKQVKVEIAMIRAAQKAGDIWPDMELCDRGFIYYMARDSPYLVDGRVAQVQTAEFMVEHDERFWEVGLQKLLEWKAMWESEALPSLNPLNKAGNKGRHPNGWRWSYPPCTFCDFKKVCQADHKADIDDLSESTGIDEAKLVRPEYSYKKARERVKKRWAQVAN